MVGYKTTNNMNSEKNMNKAIFVNENRWFVHYNRSFAHFQFDSKITCFYTSNRSYFPYKRQNVTCSSTSKQKDKEFEYNFLIICNYLNLPKKNFRGQFFGKK